MSTFRDYLQSFLEKLQEPLLPTHLLNFLLSAILLGCINNSYAEVNGDKFCGFKKDNSTCSSTSGFAAIAFLTSLVFLVVEFRWEHLANYHRYLYLGELIVSAIFAIVFFGFFVKLADGWAHTDDATKNGVSGGNAGMSIAAAFFSILSWTGLAYLSYKGYKEDDLGGIERLGTYGQYVDPVTSSYHAGGTGAGYEESDPPVP